MNEQEKLYKGLMIQLMTCESMLENIYASMNIEPKICPACQNRFPVYLPFGENLRKNARCPHCRSLERHRTLWLYFKNHTDLFSSTKNIKLLHFAPEDVFLKKFATLNNIDYYPVDFNPRLRGIRDAVDVQHIKYDDEMFDIVICNHVLEHVEDDHQAIRELRRVLKKDGVAYIDSPVFKIKTTLEDPEYNTPELRFKHYGQHDHLRRYGMDYVQRLENGGFLVNVIEPNKNFKKEELLRYGIKKGEKIYLCTK